MSFCPNVNTPEFKEMESVFGREIATRIWVENKGNSKRVLSRNNLMKILITPVFKMVV